MAKTMTGDLRSGARPTGGFSDALSALGLSLEELREQRPELVAELEAQRAAGAQPSELLKILRDALADQRGET